MEELPTPEELRLAYLSSTLKAIKLMHEELKVELQTITDRNTIHLKYEINLAVAHSNYVIADFRKMGVEINALTILPLPSAISIKLRGIEDESIDLETYDRIDISNHSITRLLITNSAGTGTAKIHVFGKSTIVIQSKAVIL